MCEDVGAALRAAVAHAPAASRNAWKKNCAQRARWPSRKPRCGLRAESIRSNRLRR